VVRRVEPLRLEEAAVALLGRRDNQDLAGDRGPVTAGVEEG
jgi:hypothetical protein